MQKHSNIKNPFTGIYNYLIQLPSGIVVIFFALVVFSIYSNSFNGPFVFDDVSNIERNEAIRLTSLNWEELKKPLTSLGGERPVSMLSFALNYYFNQYDVFWYHLVNVLIHLSNAVLLYVILQTIFSLLSQRFSIVNNPLVAFYSSLLWLAHPLHTQSVTYIVQRENSMATMFFLLAFFFFLKARIIENKGPSRILFVSSVLTGVIAFFSKQNAATLPVFIFLSEWFFFQNLSVKWLKRNYLVILAVVVVMSVLTVWCLGTNPLGKILGGCSFQDFTLGQRVLTQFRVVVLYMSLLIFPHPFRLNLDHDVPVSYSLIDPITTIISMMLIFFLVGFAIIYGRRERLLSFCILWFFGNLLIESSVICLEMVFEHRTYLPSTFFVLAIVLVGYRIIEVQKLRTGIIILLFSILSFWTFERNKIWANDLTLWLDSAGKSPNKSRPYSNAGQILIDGNRYNEAQSLLVHAVKINPSDKAAQNNLGMVYSVQGNLDGATHHIELALKVDPNFADAHNNLGIIYMKQGAFNKASIHFSRALKRRPYDVGIISNLGVTKAKEGKFDEAITHFLSATKFAPEFAASYANIGDAYKDLSKYEEAHQYYSAALERDPSNEKFKRKLEVVSTIIKNTMNQNKREN